ncbi:MAG: undecaprenyldiphospho-muramoylpentapeptide beta-N-acetylglucosaminyltransferase [Gemmatimonadota bacterium]|jgi:UDP-N-acetylglucosamine--N-acetylmuramyl-(pentapeptide) pyrophosphoryl-undecaprenol N-acetylglucosamine transferase
MKRVLLAGGGTGGHLYPALNLASALEAMGGVDCHFVGARRGVEARVLPEREVAYTLLSIEPIRRDRVWQNWRLAPSAVATTTGLWRLGRRFRPDLVVGTGGYASGPAGFWAVVKGVPLALQEQNSYPGLTTRWLSRWARQVHLGFPEARSRLEPGPSTEIFEYGNPIRPPEPDLDRIGARRTFDLAEDAVVLLVVGGSQGARSINEAMAGALERVAEGALPRPEGLEILWSTGPAHHDAMRARLEAASVTDWVHTLAYIDWMPGALAAADLAVSRAGAMGTAELAAWGVPAILVPLRTAAADHQRHNAQALERVGAAICLLESDLTPERLWDAVVMLAGDPERRLAMAEFAKDRARPDAAAATARELMRLMEST